MVLNPKLVEVVVVVLTTPTFRRLAAAVIVNDIFISASFDFVQLISDVSACDYPGEGSPCQLNFAGFKSIALWYTGLFIHRIFIIKNAKVSIYICYMY